MSSEKIGVGIIGTGWGLRIHGKGLSNCDSARIVGICGANEEKTQGAAADLGGVEAYTDYRRLLDRNDLDAVVVASPDDLHHSIVIDAIDRGKHVFCEKPLARSVADSRDMWQRAESASVVHMTAFSFYWMPHIQYFKQLIDEGYVGNPKALSMRYHQGFKLNTDEYRWRSDATRSDGTIADLGAHCFFASRWLMGAINEIHASLRIYIDKPPLNDRQVGSSNDAAFVNLGFESGVHGSISISQASLSLDIFELEVAGDKGTLSLQASDNIIIRGIRLDGNGPETLDIPVKMAEAYGEAKTSLEIFVNSLTNGRGGVGSFVQAIVEETPGFPSFKEGHQAQQIIDASIRSDESSTVVKL